ncbi:MAG: metal ABC transporter permease [Thermotogae bacterium]|nr:metal ABC transporter permease [Thermotogota bacterium]
MITLHVITALVGGLLLGLASFFVVSKNMAFATTGVAHAMFGGIALAVVAGMNPQIGGMAFGLLMGLGMFLFGRRLPQDAVIGLTFSFLMSVGAIALRFYRGYANLLWSYMFGNITLATWSDVFAALILLAVGSALVGVRYDRLKVYMFSEEIAAAEKVPINLYTGILILFQTLVIILVLRIFGSILTSSLLVVPALLSFMLFRGFTLSLLMSGVLAVLMTLGGYAVSYTFDLPYGATTTSLAFLVFVLVWLVRREVWLKV